MVKARGDKRRKLAREIDEKQREIRIIRQPVMFVTESAKNPLQAVVAHEVGHAIEDQLGVDFPRAIREAKDAGRLRDEDYSLSGYGVSHPAEMFAEITAAIHSGQEDMIPKPLREAYEAAIATAKREAAHGG
jgi:hypothetical protein